MADNVLLPVTRHIDEAIAAVVIGIGSVRERPTGLEDQRAVVRFLEERGFDGTTLRAIGARAGMGASSIYRHVRSKEELLIRELAERQEEAWQRFRHEEIRGFTTRERVRKFLDAQHALLAEDPDLTTIALTNATLPYALEIANKGWRKAMKQNPEIKLGANVVKGKVTYKGVADAFGLRYTPVGSLLK